MAAITIAVDTAKAQAALAGLTGPQLAAKLGAGLRELALLGERTVSARTPVRTGALRASIKASPAGPLAYRIASPLGYVTAVEEGTRAHEIRPRGRVLRFQVGGSVVFARRVRHPGSPGRKMFAQAAPVLAAAAPGILATHARVGR